MGAYLAYALPQLLNLALDLFLSRTRVLLLQQVWTLDVSADDRRITVPSLVVGVNCGQLLTLSVTSPVGPS